MELRIPIDANATLEAMKFYAEMKYWDGTEIIAALSLREAEECARLHCGWETISGKFEEIEELPEKFYEGILEEWASYIITQVALGKRSVYCWDENPH